MKIQKISITALLVAMCVIGANIKVAGSIAFDSAPAFIGTLLLGPAYGAALGFIGHLVSALIAGFPLSLPVHMITAVMMAITMLCYGAIRIFFEKKGKRLVAVILSVIVAFMLNCPVSLLVLYPLLKGTVFGLLPFLAVVSICNIALAEIVYAALPAKIKSKVMIRG